MVPSGSSAGSAQDPPGGLGLVDSAIDKNPAIDENMFDACRTLHRIGECSLVSVRIRAFVGIISRLR
jgi:hypothetical protein